MTNDNTPKKPPGLSPIIMPGERSSYGGRKNRLGGAERAYVPSEPSLETLLSTEHAKWLEEFSVILSISTGIEMTPFRQGQITRLHWASRYIEHLEREVERLKEENGRPKDPTGDERPAKS